MAIPETFIELLKNAGLLLGMVYIYTLVLPRLQRLPPTPQSVVSGLLFGLFGIACMVSPVILVPGYRFDNRNVMVAVAGVFGGAPGALLSSVLVIAFRFLLGGAGTGGAAASIITTAVISVLARRWIRTAPHPSPRLLLLGGLVAAQGLIWLLVANPPENAVPMFQQMALPLLLLYMGSTGLIGTLLFNAVKNQETEASLKKSHHFIERITQTVPDTLYVYDLDEQRMVFINRETPEVLGYTAAQFMEMGAQLVPNLTHPDDLPKHWSRIEEQRNLRDGEILEFEFRMRHVNGEWRWMTNYETVFARNPDQSVHEVIGFSRDITERKNAEEQAELLILERERSKILQQFISAASHDLRTPITIMKTTLYLLRKESVHDIGTQRRLNEFAAQIEHIQRLVEDMLMMSRLDNIEVEFQFTPNLLDLIVKQTVERHSAALTEKQIDLEVKLSQQSLPVSLDVSEFERALSQIIANAAAYTPRGGHICVTTEARDASAIITIQDTGIGITAEDFPHIFERFFRADKARQSKTGGSGLGLPIAQKIVMIHGGTLVVNSAPGTGTTVEIALPLANVEAGEPQALPDLASVSSSPGSTDRHQALNRRLIAIPQSSGRESSHSSVIASQP